MPRVGLTGRSAPDGYVDSATRDGCSARRATVYDHCYRPVSTRQTHRVVKLLTEGSPGTLSGIQKPLVTPGPRRTEHSVPIMARIKNFLSSAQGRRVTDQGRRMASDPRRRQQVRGLLAKLRGRPTR